MKLLMLRHAILRQHPVVPGLFNGYCTKISNPRKKYSDTLLLPKTAFPQRISPKNRPKHEAAIASNLQFDNLYSLQRLWRRDAPEFVLHDGPPYANGTTHIGHAVNKILKDITNRYKLLKGFKVNYTPGWDCHGLPIELKALKDNKTPPKSPMDIRALARKVAESAIQKQMDSFKRWGVMAEWGAPYKTFDKSYIQDQLKIFYKLYEKGFVYREMKPIHWSPSSKTALAESELEYERNHESTAVHLLLKLNTTVENFLKTIGASLPKELEESKNSDINGVIWTTTPWSLPSNEAIAINENESYTLIHYRNPYGDRKMFIILATAAWPEFRLLSTNHLQKIADFPGSLLKNFQYDHPWFQGKTCPIVHGNHVAGAVGTGLVHTAPAHGTDDFVLGKKHNLNMDCYITDDGKFDDRIPEVKGMLALTLGTAKICKVLQDRIFKKTNHTHSYPYDWRTKKPVITKASMQWFIDTKKIKPLALEQLQKVSIYPPNVNNAMEAQVTQRPYWCISRQRVWGVPIPVLIHKETQKPLIHKGLIDRLCELVEQTGSIDVWWEVPVGTLLQNEELASQYEKGQDIFDIWFDSGISWHTLGDKQADIYLEGLDQFNGWFQSSLLTSVALRGISPYKGLYIHGFVVDDTGKKMSKSLGNVLDPYQITDSPGKEEECFGADVLRWWCATQGSADADKIALSQSLLRLSDESIQKLRNTLRYLISFCSETSVQELGIDEVTYDELMHIDQFMLMELRKFQQRCNEDYENYNYHRVMTRALHFATTQVSSQYLAWIKDRLYCDSRESQSRKSCIFVLNEIYQTLVKILAPVVPHLCEEVHMHYCSEPESVFKSTWFKSDEIWSNNKHVESLMELALDVKTTANQLIGSNNHKTIWAEIVCNPEAYQKLQLLHPTNCSDVDKCTSELCDVLQVSGIDLKQGEIHDKVEFSISSLGEGHSIAGYSVAIKKTDMFQCHRCRRYCCPEGTPLCSRCKSVLQRLEPLNTDSVANEIPPPPSPESSQEIPIKEEVFIRS